METLEEGSCLSTKALIRRILVSSVSLLFMPSTFSYCSSTVSLDSIMLEFITYVQASTLFSFSHQALNTLQRERERERERETERSCNKQ